MNEHQPEPVGQARRLLRCHCGNPATRLYIVERAAPPPGTPGRAARPTCDVHAVRGHGFDVARARQERERWAIRLGGEPRAGGHLGAGD